MPWTPIHTEGFDADNSANWTQVADTNGTWLWDTAQSQLHQSGASTDQATYTHNSLSEADGALEADMTRADDAGIVLRFADGSNYYLAVFRDASSVAPNTVRIFKRVAGTFSAIDGGGYSISWTRGVQKTCRFEVEGTTLRIYFDGVLLGTVTDSDLSAAGKMGVRGSGNNNEQIFKTFRAYRFVAGSRGSSKGSRAGGAAARRRRRMSDEWRRG